MLHITINGEIKEISEEINLNQLLELFALPQERVAVELNKQVVRSKDWETIQVKDSDKIEIVHFVGGG